MDAWLKCEVSAGQFDNEAAVRGRDFSGDAFSLFALRESLKTQPFGDDWQAGMLRVEILQSDEAGGRHLIYLPAQSFSNGQAITVRSDQIEIESSSLMQA